MQMFLKCWTNAETDYSEVLSSVTNRLNYLIHGNSIVNSADQKMAVCMPQNRYAITVVPVDGRPDQKLHDADGAIEKCELFALTER